MNSRQHNSDHSPSPITTSRPPTPTAPSEYQPVPSSLTGPPPSWTVLGPSLRISRRGTRPRSSRRRRPPTPTAASYSAITTTAGVVIPVIISIPDSSDVVKGNVTIGIELDGKVHIDTVLEATLEAGDRINSRAKDSIGIRISATGGFRKEGCGEDEACMLPEVEIEIQEVSNYSPLSCPNYPT